jgi:hypothetical protein
MRRRARCTRRRNGAVDQVQGAVQHEVCRARARLVAARRKLQLVHRLVLDQHETEGGHSSIAKKKAAVRVSAYPATWIAAAERSGATRYCRVYLLACSTCRRCCCKLI